MNDKPTHAVVQTIKTKNPSPRTGKNQFYVRIGSGWEKRDGFISVKLNSIPLNGELLICPITSEEAQDGPDIQE